MSIAFMRPVREGDVDAVAALARQAGGGMTNLPADRDALKARIDFACESFAKNAKEPGGEVYMLVLERGGKVIGTAGIFSAIGLEHGFVNYRIVKEFYSSSQLGKRCIRRALVPTHDFTRRAEVGMLFISPDARGGGYGKLLARSRYMFIAQKPEIIADHVCAELRGWRSPDGEQPFWNAVGRHFFDMEFEEADGCNAAWGNEFVEDMMPRYPIYAELLPPEAQACLGRPHDSAAPALKMLLGEGFVFHDYIDVFDGGPLVDAKVKNIKTIKESRVLTVSDVAASVDGADALLAAGAVAGFRCCRGKAKVEGETVALDKQTAAALNIEKGGAVRWAPW